MNSTSKHHLNIFAHESDPQFEELCKNFLPKPVLSEYWLSNLLLHHHIYNYSLHRNSKAAWITGKDRKGTSFILPLKSCDVSPINGASTSRFYPLPNKDQIAGQDSFYNRDLSDYIYETHEQQSLNGNSFSDIRWLNRRLSHINWTRYQSVRSARDTINIVLDRWVSTRKSDDFQDHHELTVMLTSRLVDSLECIVASDNGNPHLFAILDSSQPPYLLILFIKDDRSVRNLNHLIIAQCARLFPEFEEINLCQDLGISGLRRFKLGLRPAEIRHKWSIITDCNHS